MAHSSSTSGIVSGRLDSDLLEQNFEDLHAPLSKHEALVASDRCYFCHDAPCMTACPTSIDIPLFIRQIATGTTDASAKTILSQNILGGMCARVCPTETLCEEACVREVSEGKPVEIGRLQRFATDNLMAKNIHPFSRGSKSGKKVAVIGAGPAGLACAHKLATLGHEITIYEAREKGGGLNEFGIAAYKSIDNFAQKELDWLLSIGGIKIEYGKGIGTNIKLDQIQSDYDATFIGMGLSGVNSLRCDGENLHNVDDAVSFISDLRQADSLSNVKVGRDVVVIGGGMTAVDAAVQSKLLGAQNVSLVYRRGKEDMSASVYEQELATSKGVRIIYNATPLEVTENGSSLDVKFGFTESIKSQLKQTGETFSLPANQVLKAIGQNLSNQSDELKIIDGKINVNEHGQTNISNIWAGGDCAIGGDDLTVTAVAQGRDAAVHINSQLMK